MKPLQLLIVVLLLISCSDSDDCSTIVYQRLDQELQADGSNSLMIDLDRDDQHDFQVTIQNLSGVFGDSLVILVNPFNNNEIKTWNSDGVIENPGVFPYIPGSIFDESTGNDEIWWADQAILGRKYSNGIDIFETGNWVSMNSSFIAAVRLQKSDAFLYGWIKLQYNDINNSLVIIDLAINQDPDAFIISGARSYDCDGAWTLSE